MKKNIPNIITIVRVVLVPFIIFFYLKNSFGIAFLLFVLASLSDFIDGKLARKYDIVSNFGKFLDPLADKILNYSILCLFVFDKTVFVLHLIIALFREFAIAGVRMLAASKGSIIAADLFGKLKTIFQMASIIVLLIYKYLVSVAQISILPRYISYVYTFGIVLLYISTVLTIISGLNYIIKYKEVFND